jgi:hypothetical protein
MAKSPYSTKLVQAFANIDPQKRVVAALAKDPKKKAQYAAAVKQLEAYQKTYDDLKVAEENWKESQKKKSETSKGAAQQTDLDIALATKDTNKANQIARDMANLGVQPVGLDGEPLTGFEVKDKDAQKGYLGTGSKDKPLTLDGDNFTGKYKGKDYKNGILVTKQPTPTPTPSGKGGNTPPPATGGGPDVKDLWMSYLRSTFATLEDKTQKAEIDLLIKRAKDEKWDEDTFMDALEGTVWWQSTYPSMRQFFLDTHDPRKASTFAEKVSNTMDTMMGKLEALGITVRQVDPATGKVIDNTDFVKGIALKSIENNWDDDQLEQYLAKQGSVVFSGGGTLGSYYDRIAQQAYLYGVPLDETMKQTINTSLLDPLDGRDANYWIKTVKDMAYDAPQNKPFLASLQAGRNLYEVTNSYRQQMANLLEVDSTAITWNDLMGKVVDNTTGNARTFADFTKQLKTDPLWQYTRNAKETYSNTALDIAKMFGFMG